MLKKFKSLKVFSVLPVLVLLGFLACVVHIVPQVDHAVDSQTEHNTTQVACVDHQVSVSSSHKDHSDSIQVAILPQTSIQPVFASNVEFIYSSWNKLYSPPNKTALYIKNNTFLI